MLAQPEVISTDQLDAAQGSLDDAGLSHWKVTPVNGAGGDPLAYFKAERVGPRQEVIHREVRVLLKLAAERDAAVAPKPVAVVDGLSSI